MGLKDGVLGLIEASWERRCSWCCWIEIQRVGWRHNGKKKEDDDWMQMELKKVSMLAVQ